VDRDDSDARWAGRAVALIAWHGRVPKVAGETVQRRTRKHGRAGFQMRQADNA
jgi:hypothetical protein